MEGNTDRQGAFVGGAVSTFLHADTRSEGVEIDPAGEGQLVADAVGPVLGSDGPADLLERAVEHHAGVAHGPDRPIDGAVEQHELVFIDL
jgi:hypothetical protein